MSSSKMNSHMLAIKADMLELLLKKFREAVKSGKEEEAGNLLYEIRVQCVQAGEYFPLPTRVLSEEEEVPEEHDAYARETSY